MSSHFTLPIYIDLSATCLYAMTGALLAIRRHYDVIGLFVLALVSGVGGGLMRDVLVSDEPLLFKPGQLYVLAALIGASLFTLLILYFKMSATAAALLAIGCCFVFRMLAIAFDWKTVSVLPTSPEQS